MFKRAISGTSKAFIFFIGPSLKCSYQNMATNLKSVVGTNTPSATWMMSSSSSQSTSLSLSSPAAVVREGLSRMLSSRISVKFSREGFRRGRGHVVRLGFSLGILGFFEKKEEELSVEDRILMEMKRAILAIQDGDIKKAEGHLDKAWTMSEDEAMEKAQTQILDIRANLKFQIGDLVGAERLFKLVCQRLVYHQDVSVKDNSIVEISIKLSQIMELTGRHDESMSGFQYCADTQREKIEKEGVVDEDTILLAAWSLHSLSQAYLARGTHPRIDEKLVKTAFDLATEAYKYATKAMGADSSQAVAINSDLASIYALRGDLDAALDRYKECEAIAAVKHTYLQPAIRVNTGSLYLQKGNYDKAERLCKEAKKLAGKYRDKETALRAEECIVRVGTLKAEDTQEQTIKKGKSSSPSPGVDK